LPAPGHWDDVAIVLTDGASRTLRAVSAEAGRAGVRAGMRITEARALCADLHELAWDDVAINASITEMSALLVGASPQVTPVTGTPGLWWVGASGFEGIGGERALAHELLTIAKRWHPRPRVAIADSCVAARAATWAGASFQRSGDERSLVHVVAPGHDAEYLSSAPLALVPMEEELREALGALGLRTVGAFASLEAEDVERRWGEIGLRAWRLARADDPRRPVLARAETHPAVEVELGAPAATMEPVLFIVRSALDRLTQTLIAHGRAIAAIAITLTLDDARGAMPNAPAHTVTREARMARPMARVLPLFERCRALLDSWSLDAPVSAVRVAIVAAAPLSGEQGDLLNKSWRDYGAADAAIERLRAELGPGSVVRAQAQDTHRPEKSGVWSEGNGNGEPGAAIETRTGNGGGNGDVPVRAAAPGPQHDRGSRFPVPLTLVREDTPVINAARRALEPPEVADVLCNGEVPAVVTWRGKRIDVTRAIGPERLSGDWWDDGYRRDYWRCESGMGEVVVFLDRSDDAWHVQAWSD
jgi:protein ImuB